MKEPCSIYCEIGHGGGHPPPSPSENVSWMHIIEGRTAIATPLKPI